MHISIFLLSKCLIFILLLLLYLYAYHYFLYIGQLGIDNKKNMPIFLDILITQFIRIADSLSMVEMDDGKGEGNNNSQNIALLQVDR